MKSERWFYYIFVLLLIIFFWRTADFWYSSSYSGDTESADVLLYAALSGVDCMSLIMIFTTHRFRNQRSRIPTICFWWDIIMLVVIIYNKTPISQYPKCLAWPLFFQASYLFIRRDKSLLNEFRKFFYVLAIIGAIYLIGAMRIKNLESQTNMVYFFLLTIPGLILSHNSKWRYFILVFATFIAFISMKRSVILSLVLFWGIMGFKLVFDKGRKGFAIVLVGVMAIGVLGLFKIADNLSDGNLSLRTVDYQKEDISNGRLTIYRVTIDMIKEKSPIHLLIGNGHNGVRRDSPLEISAHNEFLEIIYDYGLIMLIIYLCFWAYILKQWLYHYRNDTIYFVPYTLSVCLFGVMALVSQLVLYVSYFLYLVMFWGMVAAAKDMEGEKNGITLE